MKTIQFSVEAGNILKEAEMQYRQGTDGDSPGMVMGLEMIRQGLYDIAVRAVELQDSRLLEACLRLGLIHENRPPRSLRTASRRYEMEMNPPDGRGRPRT